MSPHRQHLHPLHLSYPHPFSLNCRPSYPGPGWAGYHYSIIRYFPGSIIGRAGGSQLGLERQQLHFTLQCLRPPRRPRKGSLRPFPRSCRMRNMPRQLWPRRIRVARVSEWPPSLEHSLELRQGGRYLQLLPCLPYRPCLGACLPREQRWDRVRAEQSLRARDSAGMPGRSEAG